jgi:hypothetical protein
MLRIAKDYDYLAVRAEQRAKVGAQSRDISTGDDGPYPRSRLPGLAGLLRLGPVPSQRYHER